jgi:hypothetical protein
MMMDDAMMGVGLLFKGVVLGYYFYKALLLLSVVIIVVSSKERTDFLEKHGRNNL